MMKFIMSKAFIRRGTIWLRRCRWQSTAALSYACGVAEGALLGGTIGSRLQARAQQSPQKTAYVFPENQTLTFTQLLHQADLFASALFQLGLKPGDRVGVWAPNCIEWIIAQYGTARGGFILVTINPAYRSNELEYSLKKVGVKMLLFPEKLKTQMFWQILANSCPELADMKNGGVLTSKRIPNLKFCISLGSTPLPGCLSFVDLMKIGEDAECLRIVGEAQQTLQMDDDINIQFTSGTTGSPKGATLTHHNILNNSYLIGLRNNYRKEETIICCPVPLYHCFGLVMASLQTIVHGATVVFPSPTFEPLAALKAVQEHKCTSLYGTPTMFIDMLSHSQFAGMNLSSLHTGIMAGASCPIEVMMQVVNKMHMPEVTICYGSTEVSPVVTQSFVTDSLEKRVSTVGRPQGHTEIQIVDKDGYIVPRGSMGELCARGYMTMRGYWDDPERTAAAIDKNRWYHSGDLAVMDDEDFVIIVGRNTDMIIRGGENIYPLEIEQLFYTNSKVADVQVIGVASERLGEEVCAWIKLRAGQTSTEQEMREFCRGKISHFKVPSFVLFVDEFPLTPSGKVKKYQMHALTPAKLAARSDERGHYCSPGQIPSKY